MIFNLFTIVFLTATALTFVAIAPAFAETDNNSLLTPWPTCDQKATKNVNKVNAYWDNEIDENTYQILDAYELVDSIIDHVYGQAKERPIKNLVLPGSWKKSYEDKYGTLTKGHHISYKKFVKNLYGSSNIKCVDGVARKYAIGGKPLSMTCRNCISRVLRLTSLDQFSFFRHFPIRNHQQIEMQFVGPAVLHISGPEDEISTLHQKIREIDRLGMR